MRDILFFAGGYIACLLVETGQKMRERRKADKNYRKWLAGLETEDQREIETAMRQKAVWQIPESKEN